MKESWPIGSGESHGKKVHPSARLVILHLGFHETCGFKIIIIPDLLQTASRDILVDMEIATLNRHTPSQSDVVKAANIYFNFSPANQEDLRMMRRLKHDAWRPGNGSSPNTRISSTYNEPRLRSSRSGSIVRYLHHIHVT